MRTGVVAKRCLRGSFWRNGVQSCRRCGSTRFASWGFYVDTHPKGVRLFLARAGRTEQALATLDQVEHEAEGLLAFGRHAAADYYVCRAPFQEEEGHLRAFVFTFMVPLARLMKAWAVETRAEIESWDDLSPDGKGDRAIELIRAAVEGRVSTDRASEE